jgi:hypothetical protein
VNDAAFLWSSACNGKNAPGGFWGSSVAHPKVEQHTHTNKKQRTLLLHGKLIQNLPIQIIPETTRPPSLRKGPA